MDVKLMMKMMTRSMSIMALGYITVIYNIDIALVVVDKRLTVFILLLCFLIYTYGVHVIQHYFSYCRLPHVTSFF